jgi:hypothetical protein
MANSRQLSQRNRSAPHAAGWMIHSSTRVTRLLDEQLSTSMANYSRVKLSAILSYAQRTAGCQAVHHDVHRPFFIGMLELGDASPPDSHHDTPGSPARRGSPTAPADAGSSCLAISMNSCRIFHCDMASAPAYRIIAKKTRYSEEQTKKR